MGADLPRELTVRIRALAEQGETADRVPVSLVAGARVGEIAREFGLFRREVEVAALEMGVVPARYLRNFNAFTSGQQIRLLRSTVGMVGLGGLGGLCLETLARMGVGRIRAADGDLSEESNFNRQLLATEATIGALKSEAARARACEINPSVEADFRGEFLTEAGMDALLDGTDLAIDALGGLKDRLALQRAATKAGVPLVTGAIAGFTGYVSVVLPGQPGPAEFMGDSGAVEDLLGTQAPGVYAVASLMCNEAVKLLATGHSPLAGKMLIIDLEALSFETVSLAG